MTPKMRCSSADISDALTMSPKILWDLTFRKIGISRMNAAPKNAPMGGAGCRFEQRFGAR